MEIEEAFGKVLRKIRVEKSISQEELAHLCGLDRTYISLMERGKRKPTINTIFALAKGLNESPGDLVIETENLLHL
ncbi:helix-turn-helix domain-containing protein [Sporosarcina koreensis]|uniref:helix-turn-helix domain-containing protein n=1 Tax=Sporosarcina koreensis TaxID=334735 RepID=UPI00075993C8|nr:helix-turn-helix transcriptional regulator [Sporosarcina koreensis]